MKKNYSPGFTLSELLIVIAIVAILLIFALWNARRQIERAWDSRRKSDLHLIQRAFEDYYNDHNCYPPVTILDNCDSADLAPYLKTIPCDPQTKLPYKYVAPDDNNVCHGYRILTNLNDRGDVQIGQAGCNGVTGCGWGLYNWGLASGVPLVAPGFNPGASPTPTQGPAPGEYACDPGGVCNSYSDPVGSGCPLTFANQYCQINGVDQCVNPANRCAR